MGDPIYRAPAPMLFEDCGWAYEHDDALIQETDTIKLFECVRCGDTYEVHKRIKNNSTIRDIFINTFKKNFKH